MSAAYFDNSATTQVCESAAKAALDAMTLSYGNPSSLHSMGFEAEKIMQSTRNILADALGCDAGSIFFTSGGTEANNLAIFSAVKSQKRYGRHILTSAAEHPSVLSPLSFLEKEGFDVTFLRPHKENGITLDELEKHIRKDTCLVSIMLVNNETGMRFPVEDIKNIVKRKGSSALIHCDGVQAFTHLPVKVNSLGVDFLSVSGHKIHAPKGIGAVYIKTPLRAKPFMLGGGQEKGIRSGTENLPGIAAFGAAVTDALSFFESGRSHILSLRQRLIHALSDISDFTLNSPLNGAEHILNFSIQGFKAETMLHFLSEKGVFVSSGAACSSKKGKSHVLKALGLNDNIVNSALRVSFSRYNTGEDLDRLISALYDAVKALSFHR